MKIERAVDRYNREILRDARSYTISGYTPRSGWTQKSGIESLREAKSVAQDLLKQSTNMRTVLLYAADQHQRHVMVGSYDRMLQYKAVEN